MSIAAHPSWFEVALYLGDEFDPRLCNGQDDKVLEAFRSFESAEEFYAQTSIYIYHGLAYFLEGIKRPYYAHLLNATQEKDPYILDYGCGAGDDGLFFLHAGYRVAFADLPSRSLDFLHWRTSRHILEPNIYEIGRDKIKDNFDVIWCMDVLEHQFPEHQIEFLSNLTGLGDVVFVNLVNDPHADGALHHAVDIDSLTRYAEDHSVHCEHYDFFDGKVRLLIIVKNDVNHRLTND